MTATAYIFGNKVIWDSEKKVWLLALTNEVIDDEMRSELTCPQCHLTMTKDGHDPCIANLPGVKFACCGHGSEKGYIYFENETTIRGRFDHT